MAIKPDTFLLITLSSGFVIIAVGLIIVMNCSLDAFSCQKLWHFLKNLCRARKKGIRWSKNIVFLDSEKRGGGASLVEGRPQGHGFYSAGPSWSSSTETTSTIASATSDGLHNICLMTQFSDLAGTTAGSTASVSATDFGKPVSVYSNFGSSTVSTSAGFHGDNSAVQNTLQAEICSNCNGAGLLATINPATSTSVAEFGKYQYEEYAIDSTEMDGDGDEADADMMMMCM